MIEKLDQIDKRLFLFLNGFHNESFDLIMFYVSKMEFWIPLFVVLVYLTIKEFKRNSIIVFIMIALTVGVSDQVSSSLIKPYFKRFRPCHDSSIQKDVHIVKGCGGKYGFVSSHASNTFAVAMFFVLLFNERNSRMKWLFLWAILVSFSRIYLGKHYPGDLIAGGILGLSIAIVIYKLTKYLDSRFFPADHKVC